ncbi:hypothetical protein Pelo_9850 [Pelomyxa schiedti]|nr:hypothetical protein Pelo_9850 [Pelomyxa schiedti]
MQTDNTQFFPVVDSVPLTKGFSWDELREILESGKTELLGRDPQILALYVDTMRGLKGTWKSVDDFVLVKHFGWIPHLTETPATLATIPWGVMEARRPEWYDEATFVQLSDNDYPYWVADGIRHQVLWSGRHLTEAEVDNELGRALGPHYEVMWYENKGDRKSVKRLHHVQCRL